MVSNTDKQKELAELAIKQLAILYWDKKYGGKFLGHVELDDLPQFFEYAVKELGYIKPSVKLELKLIKYPHPETIYDDYEQQLLHSSYHDGFEEGSSKQLSADQQAVSVLVEKAKQDVADEAIAIINELVKAFHDYEMDVDIEPPLKHMDMINRANSFKSKYQRKG